GNLPAAFSYLHVAADRPESADVSLQDAPASPSESQGVRSSRSDVSMAHNWRGGSFCVLCGRNCAVSYQCRYHVWLAQVRTGNWRCTVPPRMRRRDARGDGPAVAGPRLLLKDKKRKILHQWSHRA